MPYPNNEILLQYLKSQFKGIETEFGDIKIHLSKLNGQVESNSEFRAKATGIYIGIAGAVGVGFSVTTLVVSKIF